MNIIRSVCAFCGAEVLRKRQAVDVKAHFCDLQCKANYQRLAKPVDRKWLEHHYLDLGLDCAKISVLVGRDPKSVWNWLKDFGIPTRKRGTTGNHLMVNPESRKGRVLSEDHREKIRQARKKDGRVPYLKDGVHWLKHEGAKPASWMGGISPERQAAYATTEWKECVKAVWARDDATCRMCGLDHRKIDRGAVRFDLHHIDSFSIKESRFLPENVVLLCYPCHRFVHSKGNKNGVFIGKGHRSKTG